MPNQNTGYQIDSRKKNDGFECLDCNIFLLLNLKYIQLNSNGLILICKTRYVISVLIKAGKLYVQLQSKKKKCNIL